MFSPATAAETVRIEAGAVSGDRQTLRASGEVKVRGESGLLCANDLQYDRQSGVAKMTGSVRIETAGANIRGESAVYDFRNRRGEMGAFHADLGESDMRAEGSKLILQDNTLRAAKMTLTSCPADSRDWQIVLDGAQADGENESVRGDNAFLEWRGTPVLWMPFVSWNYGKNKKSGFLSPSFAYHSDGFDIKTPLYWFLRDNYDATFTPRWQQEHGWVFSGEARYLFENMNGDALIEWAPFESQDRGRQKFAHAWQGEEWRATLHADNVSDVNYFKDFSDDPEELGLRHLPRAASFSFRRDGWRADALAADYKILRSDHAPPHDILPMARVGGNGELIGARWSADSEYANFRANASNTPEGARLFSLARFERDWFWNGAALTPAMGVHWSRYRLRGDDTANKDADFAVPFARLDVRRRFLWQSPFGGAEGKWRAAFVYAPKVKQENAPLFDTELLQLNSARVFNWNRFVGGDRAADANFFAYGGELRKRGADGNEAFFLGAAQRYYFRAPRITLNSESAPPEQGFANLLLDLRARPAKNWRVESAAEWRPADNSVERFYADARADFGGGKLMRAGVLLEEDDSITWGASSPLGAGVSAAVHAHYFLTGDRFAEASGGFLVRDECGCWEFSFKVSALNDADGDEKIRYSVGFALGGITDIGGGYEDIIGKLRD